MQNKDACCQRKGNGVCGIKILNVIIGLYFQRQRQHIACSGVCGLHFLATLDDLSKHTASIALPHVCLGKNLPKHLVGEGKSHSVFCPQLCGEKCLPPTPCFENLGFVSQVEKASGRRLEDHFDSLRAPQCSVSMGALLLWCLPGMQFQPNTKFKEKSSSSVCIIL